MALLLWLLLIVPLLQVQSIGMNIYKLISPVTNIISQLDDPGTTATDVITSVIVQDPQSRTIAKVNEIMNKVDDLTAEIRDFDNQLNQKLDQWGHVMVDQITIHQEKFSLMYKFDEIRQGVNYHWDHYLHLMDMNKPGLQNQSLQQFISAVTDFKGIRYYVYELDSLINGNGHTTPNLVQVLLQYFEVNQLKTCGHGPSNQQDVELLFTSISMIEYRAFLMLIYAYGTLAKQSGKTFPAEVSLMTTKLYQRLARYDSSAGKAMRRASTMIRACDPADGFERGKSFAEMERAIQTVIIDEARLNNFDEDACWGSCEDRRGGPYTDSLHLQRAWMENCRYSGGDLKVCMARDNSSRLYEWFELGNSGRKCSFWARTVNDKRFFWQTCELCTCTAYESDRKPERAVISLLPVTTNYHENMVVTGVKINHESNILKLQVEEGKLGPDGQIFNGSTRWVPMPEITYKPDKHFKIYPVGKNGSPLVEKKHYVFIDRNTKTVNLDDIIVAEGHVVGGIRFKVQQNCGTSNSNHRNVIILEVLAIPFDYETGELQTNNTYWTSEKANCNGREEIMFNNPDIPLNCEVNSPTMASSLQVNFRQSGSSDSGQSTIPFWDIQEVVTSPRIPLQGVGLFHKGDDLGRYGGFLALRAHTLDTSVYVSQKILQTLKLLSV